MKHIGTLVLFGLILVVAPASAAKKKGFEFIYGTPAAEKLQLTGFDGKEYHLPDLGGKVVLVNFWATWCPPCLEEMPSIQATWDELHGEQFETLAINVGEDRKAIERFVSEFDTKLGFPLLLDPTMEAFQGWKVRGLPTSFVVNKAGQVVYKAEGDRDMHSPDIVALLRKLMDE